MTNKRTDLRKRPRWREHLYALLHGYYWLPCPICGEPHGGHEKNNGDWYQGQGGGFVVCANCAAEGLIRSSFSIERDRVIGVQVPIYEDYYDAFGARYPWGNDEWDSKP
jgi:hypothetical protein